MGTFNPATERREFIIIPTQEEISMGKNLHKDLSTQYTFIEDERYENVKRIGTRIAQVSDRQDYKHEFYLVDKDEMNAFTVPGGAIYMFTGLYDKLPGDDEIAFVLAHEIGHGAARHTIKKFQAALGYSLIGSLIIGQIDSNSAQRTAAISSGALMGVVFSAYGRKDEYEADRLGMKYMYLAGYDAEKTIDSLEVLQKEAKGARVPTILRSHPHLDDRINKAKEEIPLIKAEYSDEF